MLHVRLNLSIVEFTANETLSIKDTVEIWLDLEQRHLVNLTTYVL